MSEQTASRVLADLVVEARRYIEMRREANEGLAGVVAVAKARGFDPKTFRAVLRRMEMAPDDLREADAMLATYEAAIGCGAFLGEEQELVEGPDGVHRPASEVRLLEMLTKVEIWPEDADADHLVQVVERVLSLREERASITAMIRLVLKHAEGIGLDPKGITVIVRQMEQDSQFGSGKRIALESVVAAYRHVLGIAGPTGPVRLPPPVPVGALPAPKKLTAKEKQFREAMAITIATQSFSTH